MIDFFRVKRLTFFPVTVLLIPLYVNNTMSQEYEYDPDNRLWKDLYEARSKDVDSNALLERDRLNNIALQHKNNLDTQMVEKEMLDQQRRREEEQWARHMKEQQKHFELLKKREKQIKLERVEKNKRMIQEHQRVKDELKNREIEHQRQKELRNLEYHRRKEHEVAKFHEKKQKRFEEQTAFNIQVNEDMLQHKREMKQLEREEDIRRQKYLDELTRKKEVERKQAFEAKYKIHAALTGNVERILQKTWTEKAKEDELRAKRVQEEFERTQKERVDEIMVHEERKKTELQQHYKQFLKIKDQQKKLEEDSKQKEREISQRKLENLKKAESEYRRRVEERNLTYGQMLRKQMAENDRRKGRKGNMTEEEVKLNFGELKKYKLI